MIVCIDKWYSASKLLLLGRGSSALFPPLFTNREFRALVLKSVQDPEGAATNFQPMVLLREGLSEQRGPELLEEGGGKVRGGIKAEYILGKLMEIFEVCSQWS